MKYQVKFLTVAVAAMLTAGGVCAQTAGTWMVRAGVTQLAPSVNSSCLSAPDFGDGPTGCTKSDVSSDTQLSGGITYMYTDHWSVDVPLALPLTLFLQYRFLEANAKFRPYVGLGVTYAYFFNEEGSGRLTATTNPGGPPTQLNVDAKFILTPQIGATLALNEKWFIDVFYTKSKLSTTTHMSTGQHMDMDLDPAAYGIAV